MWENALRSVGLRTHHSFPICCLWQFIRLREQSNQILSLAMDTSGSVNSNQFPSPEGRVSFLLQQQAIRTCFLITNKTRVWYTLSEIFILKKEKKPGKNKALNYSCIGHLCSKPHWSKLGTLITQTTGNYCRIGSSHLRVNSLSPDSRLLPHSL